MSITLYTGPMFSGKTSALISKYVEGCTVCFKLVNDNRYEQETPRICSHDGLSIPCIDTPPEIDVSMAHGFDVVIIDEGQFFNNLVEVCVKLANMGVNVYVSALNGTSELGKWQTVSDLLPHCDDIIHLKAKLCMRCRKNPACFTALRQGIIKNGAISIGGIDKYEPVCRKCYFKPQ